MKSGARARKGLRHQEGPAAVSLGGDEDGVAGWIWDSG